MMQPPASDRPSQTDEIGETLRGSVDDWLAVLAGRSREIGRLLGAPSEDQERQGYRHTLREIGQLLLTGLETTESGPEHLPVVQTRWPG